MYDPAEPTPTDSPQRSRSGQSKRARTLAAVVAAGLTGGVLWATFGQAGAEPVRLEPTSSAGASPFMSPVGQDRANVTPPANVGGKLSGDTAGMFGDNGDQPSCDAQSLIANLQGDASKAEAWAEVLNIEAADIPGFVDSLRPVVLRSDTAVTNHDYENGTFKAYPAVLQAGTSVFINNRGEPTVKCFSGNPLTKGTSDAKAGYTGTSWGHFKPGSVTSVEPTRDPIQNQTFVDIDTGSRVTEPGKPDPKPGPTQGKRDPALDAAAAEARQQAADARQKANEAGKIAGMSRAVADDKKVEAELAATEAARLEAMFGPNDPRTIAAKANAEEKANQFKFAQAKAINDGNVQVIANANAEKLEAEAKAKQEAADKAAGGPAKPLKPQTKQVAPDQQGQTKPNQKQKLTQPDASQKQSDPNTGAQDTGGDTQTPNTGGHVQSPSTGGDAHTSKTGGNAKSPSTGGTAGTDNTSQSGN